MGNDQLAMDVREGRGRGYRNRLKSEGKVPAVLYGRAVGSLPVQVDTKDVTRFLEQHGAGGLVEVSLNQGGKSKKYHAIIKDVQYHPFKREVLHVDFLQISLKEEITTHVALRLVGEAVGSKKGGLVEQHLRQVEIACMPTRIPEAIEVDISGLDLGDSIHVGDLSLPEGVRLLTEEDVNVVSISAPRHEIGENDTEAGAADNTGETPPEEK